MERKVTRVNIRDCLPVLFESLMEAGGLSDEDRGTLFGALSIIKALPEDDRLPMKTCSRCMKMRPSTSKYFDYLEKASDGLAYRCKKCRCKYMSNYGRQTRKRNRYPDGDLEEIQRHRDLAGVPREKFPTKHTPSKMEVQLYALESLAPKPEGAPGE